jgi:hypothetical protein
MTGPVLNAPVYYVPERYISVRSIPFSLHPQVGFIPEFGGFLSSLKRHTTTESVFFISLNSLVVRTFVPFLKEKMENKVFFVIKKTDLHIFNSVRNSTNPWMSWVFALTYPNPGYGKFNTT